LAQNKNVRKSFKSLFRSASQQVFKGKNKQQKIIKVKAYLHQAKEIVSRCQAIVSKPVAYPIKDIAIVMTLKNFIAYATKFNDYSQLVARFIPGIRYSRYYQSIK
jgi:hypothetical protein